MNAYFFAGGNNNNMFYAKYSHNILTANQWNIVSMFNIILINSNMYIMLCCSLLICFIQIHDLYLYV